MEAVRLALEPTSVPEWDAEDKLSYVLAVDEPLPPDPEEAQAMLKETVVELPLALDWTDLVAYATAHKVGGGLEIPPDSKQYDFFLSEIPLTLVLPPGQRLVRLRLDLAFSADGKRREELLAYDLFPTAQVDVKTLMSGEASLDVSAALQFALIATWAGAPLAPLAKALGLKLTLPFKWTSEVATVQSSGRMSNPIMWYIADSAIQNGFSATVIVRVPKGTKTTVTASLIGDLRQQRLPMPGWWKVQFGQPAPRTYTIG